MKDTKVPRAAKMSLIGGAGALLLVIGFFALIFFWKSPAAPEIAKPGTLRDEDKKQMMQQLDISTERTPTNDPEEYDPEAEAKLKILESLNTAE